MLATPYGNVKILFDGKESSFDMIRVPENQKVWPDVKEGFLLRWRYLPDGGHRVLQCVIDSTADSVQGESGERLEMTSLYYGQDKVSIGVEAEFCDPPVYEYDFGGRNLLNGLEIELFQETKEQYFIFGVAWLRGVDEDTDVQTWFAADPTITGREAGWNKHF